jgi:hypothetical protein
VTLQKSLGFLSPQYDDSHLRGPDSGIYASLRQAELLEVEGIRQNTKRLSLTEVLSFYLSVIPVPAR